MALYYAVPLLSFIAYFTLACIAFRHKPRRMVHKTFILYLVGVAVWAGLMFVIYGSFSPKMSVLLSQIVLISGFVTCVTYYHFLRAFMDKPGGVGVYLGYAVVIAAIPFVLQNNVAYLISGPPRAGAESTVEYTAYTLIPVVLVLVVLVLSAIIELIKQYRRSTDPLFRNRITYLLAGSALMILFGMTKLIPVITQYPLAHIGNLANAVFMSYTIIRFNLLDIRVVIQRGLVYFATGICFVSIYLGLLFVLLKSLHLQASYIAVIASAGVALLIAVLFYPLRDRIQKWTDRLVYKDTYHYRSMLLAFAEKMSHVLDIDELAETMRNLITKAIHVKEVTLYLPDDLNGNFIPRYSTQNQGDGSNGIILAKDNPIVSWLDNESQPLRLEQIDIVPILRSLWQSERDQLMQSKIELFFPIKSKETLVGILTLGKKKRNAPYRSEDLDLVMTMAGGAGVVMENAQLYAAAKERASIDELTGLFNHRCFHERLDGEIARCSRFGEIFSLFMLDLDLFKTFNDGYGHLAGDDFLKQLGQQIQSSIRSVDMGFRYGGDEFAVILPQASLEGAYIVAERVRKKIETQLDSKGIPVTCSIGISSWPTDGVMREDIIRATDAALYYAKVSGRNRTCLAPEVGRNEMISTEVQNESNGIILSTIYALAATVDAKDHHTYGHSKKVSKYATDIAEALGYSQERIASIRAAALLHDIGKIGISDLVLQKTEPLTDDDWKPIRAHPNLGVAILRHVGSLKDCLAAVQYHHERYDGGGYPTGLRGENIPLDARILAVADAYDAMTSARPYRPDKFTPEQALQELQRCAGSQFDPAIVDKFVSLMKPTLSEEAVTTPRLLSDNS